ncbi:MAG: tRNA (adenosine(37)-N6)-dimethylallyltransferase MiaA [Deltaproteobacteria bacterium]|nr:tRNA (adenosine(37)-N6)-dimethylallyltransferase MiaA [Deltaproteobacteria bacterium]
MKSPVVSGQWSGVRQSKTKIVVIVGPTASGKSKVALELAERFNGEIVNADSMQVYRYMDIGTAKPSKEYRERVRHHLIDIRNPDEEFDAAQFRDEASKGVEDILSRGYLPIVTGGTGLYLKALTEGLFDVPKVDKELRARLRKEVEDSGISALHKRLAEVDPVAAERIGPYNTHRIIRALEIFYLTGIPISQHQKSHAFSERPYDCMKIGLSVEREALYKKIDDRVDNMIKEGLVGEVSRIIAMGYRPETKAMQALGYSQICDYIAGKCGLDEAVSLIKRETRHYAKRQMTWFRRDDEIAWFDTKEEDYLERIFGKVRGFAGQVEHTGITEA